MKITKEMIREAFLKDKNMRNQLLYDFYKETYFTDNPYTAELVAAMISQDLGITITRQVIYKIHHRLIKKTAASNQISAKTPQGKKKRDPGKPQILPQPEFVFRNADDNPQPDPIREAMAHLKTKKE